MNGIYPDTTHACRRSYACRSGRLHGLDNCPYGKLHNGKSCADQDDVVCELPQTTAIAYPYSGDRRCVGFHDGNHVADNTNCTRYIVCRSGEVSDDIECADEYRYDDTTRQCLPKQEVSQCLSKDFHLCENLANGQHTDPLSSDCQSYIKCSGKTFISREYCAQQAVFNGKQCVPKPLYECPAQPRPQIFVHDLCRDKSDGLWANPRHGCTGYVRCASGQTLDHRRCNADQFFDPEKRRCTSNSRKQCKSIENSSECVELAAGFYQDKTSASSCRNYFFCHNGNRTNYQCQGGSIFDGENCVPSNTYVCPNQNPNSCHSKLDGYHKDEHAGCRAYFYCSQGRKYRYLCKEQEIFNGTTCVRRQPDETCQNMDACIGRANGYYYDVDARCRKYFYCLKQEVVTTLTCHGSKVFNGQKCVVASGDDDEGFQCPEPGDEAASQQINCVPRSACDKQCKGSSGFYADIDSGCVNYHFCIVGTKSGVLSCNNGFVFNGEICVPQEQYTCPQYCSNDVLDDGQAC